VKTPTIVALITLGIWNHGNRGVLSVVFCNCYFTAEASLVHHTYDRLRSASAALLTYRAPEKSSDPKVTGLVDSNQVAEITVNLARFAPLLPAFSCFFPNFYAFFFTTYHV
jgi:hypothetical protein